MLDGDLLSPPGVLSTLELRILLWRIDSSLRVLRLTNLHVDQVCRNEQSSPRGVATPMLHTLLSPGTFVYVRFQNYSRSAFSFSFFFLLFFFLV